MIRNQYVVAVLANGSVVQEDSSSKVGLPFGTEYSVRLINKNYHRCAADLLINGEKVARFILNAGDTSDIERYLDGNLNSGSRFKFTHLGDSQVKDKSSFENGLIEVLFFKESYKKPEPIIIREDHHYWHKEPYYPKPSNPWGPFGQDKFYCGSKGNSGTSYAMACNSISLTSSGLDGATVRGSQSQQSFTEVSGLEFESTPTIIKLKIVNGELSSTRYCSGCGRKREGNNKFCPNCGQKL